MAKAPRAVRAQVEAAERLHAEAYNETEKVTPSNIDSDAPVVQQETAPEPAPEPTPEPEPEIDWRQRYLTLQGKYNSEIVGLKDTVREQEEELISLREDLDQAQSHPVENATLATDEEKEEYGAEFTEFITRIANAAAQNNVADLTPKIKEIEGKVVESESRTKTSGVLATLDQTLEGWRQQNTDPNFLAWLGEIDPLFGQTRKTALDAAFKAGDASRVTSIFRAFRTSNQPAADPQPPAQPGKVPLAQLAGPATTAPAGAPAPKPEPEIWTAKQVTKFYEDSRLGRIPPDRYKQLEASLGKAMREGRVRPS